MSKLTEKELRDQHRADLQAIMRTAHGRRVVWQWLSITGLYANPFHDSGARTAMNCGRQSIGQQMLADLMDACPSEYLAMQQEQLKQS